MPSPAEILKRASRHHLSGDFVRAERAYLDLLKIEPDNSQARFLLGVVAHRSGRPIQALEELEKAISLDPSNPRFHNTAGQVLLALGRRQRALRAFQRAVELNPDNAEAQYHLGLAHHALGQFRAAARRHELAIQLRPRFPEALVQLGHTLFRLYRPDEAIEKCGQAIHLQPASTAAHLTMSLALRANGEFKQAVKHSRIALRLNPKLHTAHTHYALLLLQQGKLREGFREYEWRYRSDEGERRWNGDSFHGKTLLVFDEQGLGDTLQFVRYLPGVRNRGGAVILETRKALFDLLAGFPGIDQLAEWHVRSSLRYDFVVPLMSLPGILGATVDTIPNKVPYLQAHPAKVAYWRQRLSGPAVKVGLVWAGNPKSELDGARSCRLSEFAPLFEIPGVRFYSLQFGKAMKQLDALPRSMEVVNLGRELPDFSDVAAAADNLDLVVSVDTAVVHLAGAMGKPVFTVLGSDPDWRWMLQRNDSPWYPTMRLFRQKKRGDWAAVLSEAAHALREFVALPRAEVNRSMRK